MLSSNLESFELPTTDKFVWKFRNYILNQNNFDQFDQFLLQKKTLLLNEYGALNNSFVQNPLSVLPSPHKMKDAFKPAERVLDALKKKRKNCYFW